MQSSIKYGFFLVVVNSIGGGVHSVDELYTSEEKLLGELEDGAIGGKIDRILYIDECEGSTQNVSEELGTKVFNKVVDQMEDETDFPQAVVDLCPDYQIAWEEYKQEQGNADREEHGLSPHNTL